MKPISITAEGFLSFKERTEVFFDGLRFASVTGKNGAGKSSIIQAVAWAIYGETRVSGDRDSVVNDYCDTAEVSLVFQDRIGDTWRIDRTKDRGLSQKLGIYSYDAKGEGSPWVRFNSHRIDEAQNKILDVIGLSEDAFYSLMVIKQSSIANGTRFTAADSNVRRSIIMGLLPELDVWSTFHSVADDYVGEINGEYNQKFEVRKNNEKAIESDSERLEDLEEELDDLPSVEDLEEIISKAEKDIAENRSIIEAASDGRSDKALELSTLQAKRAARNAETKAKIAELENEMDRGKRERRRLSRLESDIESKGDTLEAKRVIVFDSSERLKELEGDEESAQGTLDRAERALSDKKDERSALVSQREQLNESLKALEVQADSDSAECLICKSPLTDDRAHELLHDIKGEIEQKDDLIEEANEEVERLERSRTRAGSRLRNIRSESNEIQNEASSAKGSISSLEDEIKELEKDYGEQSKLVSKLRSDDDIDEELDGLVIEDANDEEKSLKSEIDEMDKEHPLSSVNVKLTKKVSENRAIIEKIARIEGQADSVKASIKKMKRQTKSLTKDLKSLFVESDAMEWVRDACTQRGVPNELIASVLDQIQDEQNRILSRLMGDRAMQVEFRQERELKNKNTKSVLDIVVHAGTGATRVIESFSGGEQVRLTLSNLMAMVKVFNERSGNIVSTLYLDEPFGHIDVDTIPVIIDILNDALNNEIVESIIVVSHDPRVSDAIPQNMHVTRDEDSSSTQVEVS